MGYHERNLRRKQEIEEGLLAMLQEVPYDQITVMDLTEQLHIARKTFYHYFPGKQACLESLTDRLIYECNLVQLQTLPKDPTPRQFYEIRLKFWMDHRAFLEVINRNNLGAFFLDRMIQYLRRENASLQDQLSTPTVPYDEDILFFYISGQIFLLLRWCYNGFRLPLEEMVQKSLRLIHEPLLSPESYPEL